MSGGTDHDCPHCCEAQALAAQMREMMPELHAILAKGRRLFGDGHHVDAEPLPHDAQPPTSPHMRHG